MQSSHINKLELNSVDETEAFISKELSLLQRYVNRYGFSDNNIRCYNAWINNIIKTQITSKRCIYKEKIVTYSKVEIVKPGEGNENVRERTLPIDCRNEKKTYAISIFANISVMNRNTGNYYDFNNEELGLQKYKRKHILNIPCMLGSSYCHLSTMTPSERMAAGECITDRFGYFIIKGTERVINTQERLAVSFVYTAKASIKLGIETRYTCPPTQSSASSIMSVATGKRLKVIKIGLSCFAKEKHINYFSLMTLIWNEFNDNDKYGDESNYDPYQTQLKWKIAKFKEYMKLYISDEEWNDVDYILKSTEAKCLGIDRRYSSDILKYINDQKNKKKESNTGDVDENDDSASFKPVNLNRDTKRELAKKIINNVFSNIEEPYRETEYYMNNIPIHLKEQLEKDYQAKWKNVCSTKMLQLAYIVTQHCLYLTGRRSVDNRDSLGNKRLELAGRAMEILFQGLWDNIHNIKLEDKASENMTQDIAIDNKSSTMTDDFVTAFNANSWGVKSRTRKENITDILKRDSPLLIHSQISKINTPISRQAKMPNVRMVQPSQLGFSCYVKGTLVLMGDGITTRTIETLKNGDKVMTINPLTLEETPSEIKNWFTKQADEILEVTTWGDRVCASTPDHPYLTWRDGKNVWLEAKDLKVSDYLFCKNYNLPLSYEGKRPILSNQLFNKKHSEELSELKYIDQEISEDKLLILARLIGVCWTDGHIAKQEYGYQAHFYVGEETDAIQVVKDIKILGFETTYSFNTTTHINCETGKETNHSCYKLLKGGAFASLLVVLGVPVGKKGAQENRGMPHWILNASPAVKREFLSGFQGGDGSRISMNKNDGKEKYRLTLGVTQQTCSLEYENSHYVFMTQLQALFFELNIETWIEKYIIEGKRVHKLFFSNTAENITKYSSYIGYRYCAEKTRTSTAAIEYARYRNSYQQDKQTLHNKIIELSKNGVRQYNIAKQLGELQRNVSRAIKRGEDYKVKMVGINDTIPYETFGKGIFVGNSGQVAVPIRSIIKKSGEAVYDFTTVHDNHSFYANGIITHNCLFETPEGEGNGLIKNAAQTLYVSIKHDNNIIKNILVGDDAFGITSLEKTRHFNREKQSNPNSFDEILPTFIDRKHPCMLNGIIIGWCNGPLSAKKLKDNKRFDLRINRDVTIFFNTIKQTLEIYSDGCRVHRPLLIVNNDKLVIDEKNMWKADVEDLFKEGCMELVDAREQEWINLAYEANIIRTRYKEYIDILPLYHKLSEDGGERAMKLSSEIKKLELPPSTKKEQIVAEDPDVIKQKLKDAKDELIQLIAINPNVMKKVEELTLLIEKRDVWASKSIPSHSEIHPAALFSIAGSMIPFPNKEPGPRIAGAIGMEKQGLGLYHINHHLRFDTSFKILLRATRPLVECANAASVGYVTMPNGKMVNIAMYALKENQEDGIVLTKEAVDAGLFVIVKYITYKSIAKIIHGSQEERYCLPPLESGKENKYHAIGNDGIPKLGTFVKQGDCIIGKIREHKNTSGAIYKTENVSIYAGVGESGYIDRIFITEDAGRIVNVKLRQTRKPELGDKFAMRYAQKGVITGILPESQLPRVATGPNKGLCPSMWYHPAGFPSRMTKGMTDEMLLSKEALCSGKRYCGNAFENIDIDAVKESLIDNGFAPDGTEQMEHSDGMPIKDPVFVCPMFYEALKYHTADKIQARARGAVKPITHQPVRGRSVEGGIRFGTMERDSLISHGASSLLNDALFYRSDRYACTLCDKCGIIARADYNRGEYKCGHCEKKGLKPGFVLVYIPYAVKLIIHVLMGVNIAVAMHTKVIPKENRIDELLIR